jgi:eukaryotic-like serine/threonine-protein kinase
MENTLPARVRFGVFELDLLSGELCLASLACSAPAPGEDERNIVLPQQPFLLLLMLVEREGAIVTRTEIRKKFWPNDTIVEFDHSINVAIGKLRKALGDSADEPQYIETVASRGYRLMVPVEWVAAAEDASAQEAAQTSGTGGAAVRSQPEPSVLTGRTVSHYRVLDIIGGGGMGVVYRAEDLKLGRRVALKFLPEELGSDPRALERFSREARAASSLDHPNICAIHQFGDHEGRPFMVMQLLEGQTLRDRLAAAEGALPLEELLDIGIQVSQGLQAAHERGIIHRDIKPANIFLTNKGVCKILDFGLAKLLETGEPEGNAAQTQLAEDLTGRASGGAVRDISLAPMTPGPATDTHLTRTGLAMGTAGYMSPEQVRGEKLDARTDLFSFGLVLYEMATGQRAFSGETVAEVHDAIAKEAPLPLQQLNSKLPLKLVATINKTLEKDRELRPLTAADVHNELETVKREIEGGSGGSSFKYWRLATALVLLALVLAGGLYWRARRTAKLTERDTIVVAAFTNGTNDSVFDDALRMPLEVALQQSPSLNLLAQDKTAQTLKLMNRAADDRLTDDVAREVCLRTKSKAMVTSSIADAGNQYQIELKARDCQNGDELANAKVVAEHRDQVVNALGVAAYRLRYELGESSASLRQFDKPLGQAASSSLEALQAYAQGVKTAVKTGLPLEEVLSHFKRAVELDPNFPLAYNWLGGVYGNLGEQTLAAQSYRRAYELRDRTTQREKLIIEESYYCCVTRDLEKWLQAVKSVIQTYPHNSELNKLTNFYLVAGDYQKALAAAWEFFRAQPISGLQAYSNFIRIYCALDRLDDAQKQLEEARSQGIDGFHLHSAWYQLAFLQGDKDGMREQVRWAMGKPGSEDELLSVQTDTEAYYGRFAKARQLSGQAIDAAMQTSVRETAATLKAQQALRESEIGNTTEARSMAAEALALSAGRFVEIVGALALAVAGDAVQAQNLADKLNREYPLDTLMQAYWLPSIQAAIAIHGNNPGEGVEILRRSVPYEWGYNDLEWWALYPIYLRGQAYLKAGQGQAAVAEFQKIVGHRGIAGNGMVGPLAHLQLGRAQVLAGDNSAGRKSYQDFLTLWKDADPGIPVLQQAKAEYAKLR